MSKYVVGVEPLPCPSGAEPLPPGSEWTDLELDARGFTEVLKNLVREGKLLPLLLPPE